MGERTNAEWLAELSGGPGQRQALEDLHRYCLKVARYVLQRRVPVGRSLPAGELEALAEDCAQDALLAILDNLERFRGDAKFTTWAYQFAVNTAYTRANRQRWQDLSWEELTSPGDGTAAWSASAPWSTAEPEPGTATELSALWQALQEVIDQELTPLQRHALTAAVLREVPIDELAVRLGTNRNALYKLLHDARKKLRAGMIRRGYTPDDWLVGAPRLRV